MEVAKVHKDGTTDLIDCSLKQGAYITELRNTGYLDFVPSEQPTRKPGTSVAESLEVVDGKLVQSWRVVEDAPQETALPG